MEVQDRDFLEYVVKAIVSNPDDVSSERIVDERGVLLTLNVNPSDMGYVIGKQGQTANAIRTLLKIVGAKKNANVSFKINEPVGSKRSVQSKTRDITGNTLAEDDVTDDLKI
jgi:hypothetical protein